MLGRSLLEAQRNALTCLLRATPICVLFEGFKGGVFAGWQQKSGLEVAGLTLQTSKKSGYNAVITLA